TYTDQLYVHNPSVLNACLTTNEYSPLYCLSIANSTLLSEYFYFTSPKSDKGIFPKVLVEDVRRLPIRNIRFSTRSSRRASLLDQGRKICARSVEDDANEPALSFVAQCLTEDPEESDV